MTVKEALKTPLGMLPGKLVRLSCVICLNTSYRCRCRSSLVRITRRLFRLGRVEGNSMQYEQKDKMRKYYQLLLIVVSLVSLTALIFYRHEYYRLRYVLEVLNFFGDSGQKSKDSENCSVNGKARYPLINIPPSWQRVTDSLYVYSAYWIEDDGHVKTIAVDPSVSTDSLFCSLWYPDILQPSKGSVAVEFEELRGTGFLYIYCKPSRNNIGIPIATSFYMEKDSSLGVKIPVLRSYHAGHSHNVSVIVCTIPEYVTNSEAIGHLAYHQLIGVTSFIIYGQPQFQGVNVVNVPWNFPFPERQRISPAIEADCVLRARAAGATYAIALSWNEYLVPRYHRSLHSLFTEYSGSEKSVGFEIMRIDFCTELNNSQEGPEVLDLLPLRKTHRKAEKSMKYISVHSTSEHSGDQQKIPENIISLHQYVSCFKNKRFKKGRILKDPVFLRFDLDLKDALKFWLSRDVMPET